MYYEFILEDVGIKYQINISDNFYRLLINKFRKECGYDYANDDLYEYYTYSYHLDRMIFKSKIIWELRDNQFDKEVIDYCDKLVKKLYNLRCFI